MLGEAIDQEIRTAFQRDTSQSLYQGEEIKIKFKEHKKLLIRHLNRKWDVSFLDTSIEHKIIPTGLKNRITPAEHFHTNKFLPKWKELCINHGLAIMGLIVEEENIQLIEIKEQIEEGARGLEALKETGEFSKQNEILKKRDRKGPTHPKNYKTE